MFAFHLKRILKLGVKSLWMHRLRSTLTMLGIIFGVSSVVAMLAIGEGASRDAEEKISQLGSRNIIIKTVPPPEDNSSIGQRQTLKEYGLTYDDAERFQGAIPDVRVLVPNSRKVAPQPTTPTRIRISRMPTAAPAQPSPFFSLIGSPFLGCPRRLLRAVRGCLRGWGLRRPQDRAAVSPMGRSQAGPTRSEVRRVRCSGGSVRDRAKLPAVVGRGKENRPLALQLTDPTLDSRLSKSRR